MTELLATIFKVGVVGFDIVNVLTTEQPLASVTFAVYVPAA